MTITDSISSLEIIFEIVLDGSFLLKEVTGAMFYLFGGRASLNAVSTNRSKSVCLSITIHCYDTIAGHIRRSSFSRQSMPPFEHGVYMNVM